MNNQFPELKLSIRRTHELVRNLGYKRRLARNESHTKIKYENIVKRK